MNIPFVRISVIFLLLSQLTGCWSSRELNELGIATAIGIDKSKDGFLVTAQILNPGAVTAKVPTNTTPVTTFQAEGKTVFEALRKLTKNSPRKVYLSHVQIVAFSEKLAREEGIKASLDFISRDHEMRTDFYIVIAKKMRAENLLRVLLSLEKIPANKIFKSLEISQSFWGVTKPVPLDGLIGDIVRKGKEPILTGVYVKGDHEVGNYIENIKHIDPSTRILIDHLAVFKRDKLQGWLNEKESKGYNYIMGEIKSTIENLSCPSDEKGKYVGIELLRTSSKLTGEMKNGEPLIHVILEGEADIGDLQCHINISEPSVIAELEGKLNKQIEQIMTNTITKVQEEFGVDIFGFGNIIHIEYPDKWKTLREEWETIFPKLNVDINVDVKIRRLGTITETFEEESKD
ncbi:Ger(x)C family spore germination protein [Bacillus timonensis]|nr:Ger(x)C family spore germination protein [Bacillus timonensis]